MSTRDLKLKSCMKAFDGYADLPPLKTNALVNVGKAYERNIRRVNTLVLFAPAAVWITATIQRCTDEIEHKFSGMKKSRRLDLIEVEVKKQIQKETALHAKGGAEADAFREHQQHFSFHMLEEASRDFPDGPEAWMASQILATWTAFESMVEDLWEKALNTKPAILAKLNGRNSSKSKAGNDPNRIRLDYLYRYNFNLADRMGSIFLDERRYSFDRLEGIREAYLDAFSVDANDIANLINDRALDISSSIRNNLVHNGGIIDAQYLKRSAILPKEALGEVGDPIFIDGELVAQINAPIIKMGHGLIVAVDNWLDSH
jgi:hypothetical protein